MATEGDMKHFHMNTDRYEIALDCRGWCCLGRAKELKNGHSLSHSPWKNMKRFRSETGNGLLHNSWSENRMTGQR